MGHPKYSERVELPVKVDPQSARATYKNGVLEVTFKRLESSSRTSINIELIFENYTVSTTALGKAEVIMVGTRKERISLKILDLNFLTTWKK